MKQPPMAIASHRVLIVGGRGQLGTELTVQLETAPDGVLDVVSLGSDECDITNASQVLSVFTSNKPDLVVNCAAYTAVDLAETEQDKAYRINEGGLLNLANACAKTTRLIHISTDFVFDGEQREPYVPEDKVAPQSCYGASKLAGEMVLQKRMPDQSMTIRSSWIYGTYGNNFVKTMLRLMAQLKEISVVDDQIGCPTSAASLAEVIASVVRSQVFSAGVYHWSEKGQTSWYGFAVEIQKQALELGLLDKKIPIHPIPSDAYPQAAKRPAYSVLDSSRLEAQVAIKPVSWQIRLGQMLRTL